MEDNHVTMSAIHICMYFLLLINLFKEDIIRLLFGLKLINITFYSSKDDLKSKIE